jgi:hypothetical protein
VTEDEFRKGKSSEAVAHPAHYGGANDPFETIKVLEAWLTPEQFAGFCRGNALKYLSRAGRKGDIVTDLRKAAFYAEYEAKFHERRALAVPRLVTDSAA